MTGLLELGEVLLTASERRMENISRNVANVTTPGFKAGLAFQDTLSELGAASPAPALSVANNLSQGPLHKTRRPLDLAISGNGFFQLRSETGIHYTRAGQFERDADGRLVNAQGYVLQGADSGDIVLAGSSPEILADGIVLENDVPVARIGVFDLGHEVSETQGGTLFTARSDLVEQVEAPLIRQGMLEGANVEMAGEMLAMMATIRQAEIGARLVQAYDSMIGQSITTFGRAPR